MSGKGSKQRPTNKAAFDANFDRIFGSKPKTKKISSLFILDSLAKILYER